MNTTSIDVTTEVETARASLIWQGFALFNAAIDVLDKIIEQYDALNPPTALPPAKPYPEATPDDTQVTAAPTAEAVTVAAADPSPVATQPASA